MAGRSPPSLSGLWTLLDVAVDGPLHPGGEDATTALLDRAGVDSGTRLLDVGCGSGGAVDIAADRGAAAVGLDRRASGAGTVRGDLESLPFALGSFDVVVSECTLCLARDLPATLSEVRRVLSPGGRLALSDVVVRGDPPDLPEPIDELLCLSAAHQRARLDERVSAAGFRIVDSETHREELLAMRDRLVDTVDLDRVATLVGDGATDLQAGAEDLTAAVQSGDIGYVSIVARRESR